jgi:transposase
MSQNLNSIVAVIGIDIGKNSFHVVGLDDRGAIVLRQKWSRGQIEVRLANMPPCLIGMEACFGAHHLSRKLQAFGHDARLMLAKYMRPYSKDSRPSPARGQHPTTSKSGCCASRQIRVADVSQGSKPEKL